MSAEQENLRQTISDFIADPMCEADEAAWERHLQTYDELLAEVKRLREIIQVQIVTPRSKDFFFQHYGKDDFEERWKEWTDGIQDRVWGRKE